MTRMLFAATMALTVSTVLSVPGLAFHCEADMKKIDEALAAKHHWMRSTAVSGAQRAKVKSLRADGARLHRSGKHDEAVNALAEAMKILGME